MRFERWLYTVPLRIRSLFRRDDVERDLDDEIRDHIERQVAENVIAGMSQDEARAAAMRAFGGVELQKEVARDTRGISFVEHFTTDLRLAIRSLRRAPAF